MISDQKKPCKNKLDFFSLLKATEFGTIASDIKEPHIPIYISVSFSPSKIKRKCIEAKKQPLEINLAILENRFLRGRLDK